MYAGVFDRFPRLKVCLGHMGEGLSWILPRTDSTFRLYSAGKFLSLVRWLERVRPVANRPSGKRRKGPRKGGFRSISNRISSQIRAACPERRHSCS
jgi:predicted TIM-barrel fold metal-dependent hydrolase